MERQRNWNVLFPDCKSGSLQEQRRGRRIEVYWGGGENHMVEEICSNALGVEGGKGYKKKEGMRTQKETSRYHMLLIIYISCMFFYVLVVPIDLFRLKREGH